ncbi:MAG TPA: hypothetical protein VIU12_32435 [Chryseolinea sp.]
MEKNYLDHMEGLTDETHIAVWGKEDTEITRFVLVNRATQHVTKYRVSSVRFRFAGVISTPEEIKFYIETKLPQGDPRLELLTFVKKGEYFQQKVLDRETYMASFAQDGKFYRIRVDKKKDVLKVVVTNGTEADKVMEFPITKSNLEKILRKEDFEFVPQGQAISYENGKSVNKIYVRGDVIYLISDGPEDSSSGALVVMSLDTSTGKSDIRTVPWLNGDKREVKSGSSLASPPPYMSPISTVVNAGKMKHNSFLLGDQLFVFCFDNDLAALSVHDVKTGEQIKLLPYPKGTPVAFKSSDLMQDEGSLETEWSEPKTEEARAGKILKSLNKNGQPFIMVEPAAPYLRLIVGSRVYSIKQASLMSPGVEHMATGRAAAPFGTTNGTYVAVDYNYFYGYLMNSDLSAAPQSLKSHGPVDALNKRFAIVSKEIKAGKSGIIYDGAGVLLVYINKKTKEMVIEKV